MIIARHYQKLVEENIIKSDSITAIGKLFCDDDAYEGNEIFGYLEDNGIFMYQSKK